MVGPDLHLSPAALERIAPQAAARAKLERHDAHPVKLSGLRQAKIAERTVPRIVERADQDFVEGLLADLGNGAALQSPPAQSVQGTQTLRLFPPVQRRFNLAVLEAYCEAPGQPRLDPASIEGAGLVVRRVVNGKYYAWIKTGAAVLGWRVVDGDVDPALDKRALPYTIGPAFINRKLSSNRSHRNAGVAGLDPETEVTEEVVPLFTAPPAVCAKASKTLLFAVVPVSSSEQAEGPAASPEYGSDPGEKASLRNHLVHYLKAGQSKVVPRPREVLGSDWLTAANAAEQDDEAKAGFGRLGTFMLLLQQLHLEFDAFNTKSPNSVALFGQLNRIKIERDVTPSGKVTTVLENAGDFLRGAKAILLENEDNTAHLSMPDRWGALGADLAEDIFKATLPCLNDQFRAIRPAQGRFDDPAARYVVRAFVRLKPAMPGCPSRLEWSRYSEAFSIAPWHESAGGAPTLVPLPDLFDKAVLKGLKPNVAFLLPPKLANLLQADPKKLRDGKVEGAGALDLGWICSFSIPVITLCAFIVLNIFLQLLNLIFFWLPFLKICIPFPKKLPGPPA
jgi:hypothetical protein